MSQQGFLLIADITGYTMYLSRSELEHAQDVLTDLLELLIEHTRPPLVISRLAGDAVISYALQAGRIDGQTFVEANEQTYVAFRKAIDRMALNNTCQCNACANVSALDLKFFVHYGSFGVQRLGGHDELVGSDVIVIHRLLKNRVVEATGIRAYTVFTEAALEHLGLNGFEQSLVPHAETYEHLGEIRLWVQDMVSVWSARRGSAAVRLQPEHLLGAVSVEIAMPPNLVWDYLGRPEFRNILMQSERQDISHRHHGRVAPGSVYQCVHGKHIVPITVLEWEPFERVLTDMLVPVPVKNTFMMVEYSLEPLPAGGTRLTQAFAKARGPWLGRLMNDTIMRRAITRQGQRDLIAFARAAESDLARSVGTAASAPARLEVQEIRAAAASSLTPNVTA